MVKLGHYPIQHSAVAVVRTLGRLGVPTYAVCEDRFAPEGLSRHLEGRFLWPTTGCEDPALLLDGLRRIGRRIARPAVAVATDDEAAVFLAEHAAELGEHFLLPAVDPSLPRRLASKYGLYELCRAHGQAAPATLRPASLDELGDAVGDLRFPVVVKNSEPWVRLSAPAVTHTTFVSGADDLIRMARRWPAGAGCVIQEYVPHKVAQDWIVHLYCGADSKVLVGFTGVKVRSWPVDAGVTTFAYVASNPHLAELAAAFCARVGYRGVCDLDFRFDFRDGMFKLLDFNPRPGAQFRLFETEAGIDVVRALHLDLTGRRVPPGQQVDGRRWAVETLDAAALVAYRRDGRHPRAPGRSAHTELAWFAADDPLPSLAVTARHTGNVLARIPRGLGRILVRPAAADAAR